MTCTWVDCTNEATKPQVGKHGQWANLCGDHAATLEKAADRFLIHGEGGPGPMLAAWVKASGGAKKMAETM